MKLRLRVLAQPTQTDNTRTHTDYSHSQSLPQTTRTRRLLALTDMQTIQFKVDFNLRELMSDSEMRKALQEREQDFLKNMAWLDEDLDRRIRDENEKQRRYEDNLTWLDNDLNEKLGQRHQENLAWLDEDLNEKLDQRHQENLAWLDEDLNEKLEEREQDLLQEIHTSSRVPETQSQRTPKIWHCGHAHGKGKNWDSLTPEEKKSRKKRMEKLYENGLKENTCVIGHRHQQEQEPGNNTRKQYMKFLEDASEGDIIFNHCSKLGGLTHYGIFTGEISKRASERPEDKGKGWFHSFISVYEWIPLPEVVKGSGKNFTLYEVTPNNKNGTPFKNYQNYSIPS